jgi:hypothetical protein
MKNEDYSHELAAALERATALPVIKNDELYVEMPKTAQGNPRFPTRSDGVEAGIVAGNVHRTRILSL